ncbi:hypothetical protein ABES03_03235 [Neobacillus rhizosphaerae]
MELWTELMEKQVTLSEVNEVGQDSTDFNRVRSDLSRRSEKETGS